MLLEEFDGPINVEQSQLLRTILENAQYFLSVINDLSELVKIKVGKLELGSKTTIPITAEELGLHYIEKLAQKKHLKMMVTFDHTVTTVQFYNNYHLEGILFRLFKNAIRFTKDRGIIKLEVRGDTERGMADFIISDTGKGMTEKELNSLFNKEPFASLDGNLNNVHPEISGWALDKRNKDLNLGLSIVYHLIRLHGGKVSVESEVGKGSRFRVSLPWQPVTTPLLDEVCNPVQNVDLWDGIIIAGRGLQPNAISSRATIKDCPNDTN